MRLNGANDKSGEKTSSVTIDTGSGELRGVCINTDGSNNATVILYDNTAASGTKLWEHVVLGADITGGFFDSFGIEYDTGLYLSISGTGASANVYFASRE